MTIEKVKIIKRISKFIERTRKELGELIPMWLVLLINAAHLLSRLFNDLQLKKKTNEILWGLTLENVSGMKQVISGLIYSVLIVILLKRKKSTSIVSIIIIIIVMIFFVEFIDLKNY